MRKPAFGVSDNFRHKPGYTATEDGKRLKILDLGSRGTVHIVKTNTLIRCTVTMQLIFSFVFVYAKSRFTHDHEATHM